VGFCGSILEKQNNIEMHVGVSSKFQITNSKSQINSRLQPTVVGVNNSKIQTPEHHISTSTNQHINTSAHQQIIRSAAPMALLFLVDASFYHIVAPMALILRPAPFAPRPSPRSPRPASTIRNT
jgi:hypothetical protein